MSSNVVTPESGRRMNPGSDVRLPVSSRVRWVILLWGACLAYAIVRYNVFNGVEWIHLPLYVVNKSLALGGVIFIALSYLVGKLFDPYPRDARRRRAMAKFFGLTGFGMISMHIFMGFIMLSPAYYAKFFHESGKMNLIGELTFLFGVLAVGCLFFPAVTTLPNMYEALGGQRWLRAQRMGYWALAMACGHTLTMGYKGWFDVASWPGSLPPITLLGFLAALSAIVVKLVFLARGRGSSA
jgi:DMSO/TMAO reductase YedYZ heme-binding membrane subunit